jgi:hypothetical protein
MYNHDLLVQHISQWKPVEDFLKQLINFVIIFCFYLTFKSVNVYYNKTYTRKLYLNSYFHGFLL